MSPTDERLQKTTDKIPRRVRMAAVVFVFGVGLIGYAILMSSTVSLVGLVGVMLAGPAGGFLMAAVDVKPQ